MNLELLDPFGRQVPDRIDATLQLPSQVQSGAATACAFNRRGNYLAVGYADGSVAIFCTLNRTVSAIYPGATSNTNGVGSISWSRRSRRLLVGALGDTQVRLIDTTHPSGPEAAAERLANLSKAVGKDSTNVDNERMMDTSERSSSPIASDPAQQHGIVLPQHTLSHTEKTSFRDMESPYVIFVKDSRTMGGKHPTPVTIQSYKQPKQFAALDIPLPDRLRHALEIHADGHHGLAVCGDGDLYLFHVDEASFCEADQTRKCQWTRLLPSYKDIVCATFAHHNQSSVYAVRSHEILLVHTGADHATAPAPHQRIATDCATPWHLLRHQKHLLLNGADGILRFYDTTTAANTNNRTVVHFQDSVTKTTFADAAVSGDGEHVVGVANLDTVYELYIWNALSGVLVDKLTSSQQSARLSSVQWHPVRAAVCVGACADGIVDVWGPRINWTAFAPDFQALPENVEYIEREDEFDLDGETGMLIHTKKTGRMEDTVVDVLSIDPVPVFASDSEDETEVFEFETRVKNIIAVRGEGKKGRNFNSGDD